MSDTRHVMVFAYDVQNDKIRRKVAAVLEDRLVRVQRSVFEARMTRAEAQSLAQLITPLLEDGDSLRVYCLNQDSLAASQAIGGVPFPERQDFWLL